MNNRYDTDRTNAFGWSWGGKIPQTHKYTRDTAHSLGPMGGQLNRTEWVLCIIFRTATCSQVEQIDKSDQQYYAGVDDVIELGLICFHMNK